MHLYLGLSCETIRLYCLREVAGCLYSYPRSIFEASEFEAENICS